MVTVPEFPILPRQIAQDINLTVEDLLEAD
jgi:hypothetical protein